ncbi:MAG: AMP-binding protein, partial [bacterium]|nr:AMP-binding protein [bacterium]
LIMMGGEAINVHDVETLYNRCPHIRIINHYGPTEAAIGAVAGVIDPHRLDRFKVSPTIGKPIANTQVFILDSSMNPVPIGVTGEIHISGDGVARGYLNRPELTSEKFFRGSRGAVFQKSPHGHRRLYKTGDIGIWQTDGTIRFLGRRDQQMKVRGYRVELGEIESRLLKHASVKEAAVTGRQDQTGGNYICAYIVPAEGDIVYRGEKTADHLELNTYLSQTLPDYMVPSYFVQMMEIPLTLQGKLDRRALPEPEIKTGDNYTLPGNSIEETLAGIWSEVMGLDKHIVGIDDNFFKLGGHSLRATIVISKIHEQLDAKIPMADLFKTPTIRGLAKNIKDAEVSKYAAIEPVEKRDHYPLSSAQKRLYFLHQMDAGGVSYNVPSILPLGKDVRKEQLDSILTRLIARHESLRTSFRMISESPVQRIHETVEFEIAYYGRGEPMCSPLNGNLQSLRGFIRPFDLSKAPLLRSALIRLEDGNHIWMTDRHHIISDGASGIILQEEFISLYHGEELTPPELPVQYKDFSHWQNHLFESGSIDAQWDYWLDLYSDAGETSHLQLPSDHQRPEVFTFAGDIYSFKLETPDAARFKALAMRTGGTLYMNILAVLNTLFYIYTGQEDIIIGSGIAGRPHANLQWIMGMFVNTLAMRNFPEAGKTYEDFLKEVIKQSIKAFDNQDVQLEELIDRLNVQRDPSRNPLFDISMVVQNFSRMENPVEGPLTGEPLPSAQYKHTTSKFDATFFIQEYEDEIFIDIEYYTGIFRQETIQRMAAHFKNIIAAVTRQPSLRLKDIPVMSPEERKQVLEEFNDTQFEFPQHKTINRLFEEQVERTPHHIALVGQITNDKSQITNRYDGFLTYHELNRKANRLAAYLNDQQGIQPEARVGILLSRGLELPTAILAVLKAGAGYVPLSPTLPEERLKYMIDDASITTVISGKQYIKTLNRLQWECHCFHGYLCLDSSDVHNEEEAEESRLMDEELWRHVGESAVDEITGGGWVSSYTGEPFSKKEMDEYGDNILTKLTPLLHPHMRVLEIGCASGITMFRIAPKVEYYHGTDLSQFIIEKNRQRVQQEGRQNITLSQLAAHDLHTLMTRETDFDLIIINSVIQCFHGHNYLRKVIRQCMGMLGESGYLFLGDIMDQEKKALLERELLDFKYSHSQHHEDYKTKTDLSEELFIARGFITDLAVEFEEIRSVDFSPKIHTIPNELTKFRYDALIRVDGRGEPTPGARPKRKIKQQHDLRALEPYGTHPLKVEQSPHHLAYIIYTSGTTGTPRGVMIQHSSVINLVNCQQRRFQITPTERILQFSSLSFDASVEQIFIALFSGALLVLITKDQLLEGKRFESAVSRYGITHMHAVPSFLKTLHMSGSYQLKRVIAGGDICPASLAKEWYKDCDFYNEYGPTETTVTSIQMKIKSIEDVNLQVPIGKPLDNTTVYLLDRWKRPVPFGVAGELYIGGPGVARGYLNRPELTAERFISLEISGIGNKISFKRRKLSSRRNKLSFRRNTLSSRRNEQSSRRNELSSQRNALSSRRNALSSRRNALSSRRNELSSRRNELSSRRNALSSRRNELSFRRNALSSRRNNPSLSISTIYKTGDLARWLPDGNVQFLGRIDHQVKIRGFRIELEEIQSRLSAHELIKEALVIDREDETGEKYLCAYIVPVREDTIDGKAGHPETQEWREFLSRTLPDYMVPAHFVTLETLPLTVSGKVNRRELPEPGVSTLSGTGSFAPPRDGIERALVQIWSEVLHIPAAAIGIDGNFFQLGGHSLRATIVVSKIHQILGVKVPLADLFKAVTIRALALEIRGAEPDRYEGIEPIEKRDYYPLSSAQKRLYFLQQMDINGTGYNIPIILPLGNDIQRDKLEPILNTLIHRHESLRTSFQMANDEPVQRIHDTVEFRIEYYGRGVPPWSPLNGNHSGIRNHSDIRNHPGNNHPGSRNNPGSHGGLPLQPLGDFIRPFDLGRAPLMRSALIQGEGGNLTWIIDIHHIVSDGTSNMILEQEFIALYNDETLTPNELPIQYKDFSMWQNRLFASGHVDTQWEYWLDLYSDAHEISHLQLPPDLPRPQVFTFTGDRWSFKLETKEAEKFKDLASRSGGTLYMNLLAALNTLFYLYTGQTDIIIGSGIAGRPHANLQRTMGMFVNTLAMRNFPFGEKTYEDFLKEVNRQSIDAFDNQDVQLEELIDRLNVQRDPSLNPLFDVSMVVQNFGRTGNEIETAAPSNHKPVPQTPQDQYNYKNDTAKFDLTFFVHEFGDHLFINLEYYTGIFRQETIQRMAGHFKNIIAAVSHRPSLKLREIELMSPEEKNRVLDEFNHTPFEFPRHQTIHGLFEEQVQRTPNQIVLTGENPMVHLTYDQLNRKAGRVAAYLRHQQGIRPQDRVGILLSSGPPLAVAILGTLKAGAAYVPLSPTLPEERLKYMIHDAAIHQVISQKQYIKTLNRLQWECPGFRGYICLDSANVHEEEEAQESRLMDEELWRHVGESAVDEITGGGWVSSYTGEPFSKQEMDEYGDNILTKLTPLFHPRMRVLEIGCASGISMFRIAPKVGYYHGTDLSSVIIEKNRLRVKQEGHQNITLSQMAAHDIHTLNTQEKKFDLIIINSVIQCFHGHNYLRNIIRQCISLLGGEGFLFLGDIMDQDKKAILERDLLEFKYSHSQHNEGYTTKTDLSEELFISRGFLTDLAAQSQEIEAIDFSDKRHTIQNELTKFR